MNASYPLAKLTASPETLKISVFILGKYSFSREQVVEITRYTFIPVLGWGIKIRHSVPDYPERFIFWCLGNPNNLLRDIEHVGFRPQAPIQTAILNRGFALRWQALIVIILLWNSLFYLGSSSIPNPQYTPPMVVVIALGSAIAVRRSIGLQKLILKPDRNVKEILPTLNLAVLIFAIMAPIFLIISSVGGWHFIVH